jgi:light-regulated signal transduction histidine kinase (bacteriophytochrome)
VYNLLTNAIKYRSPARTAHIILSCHEEGDYHVLSVQDNGLGMNTSNPEKIFGMFKRQRAHVEGTGVGLYIVKKMVENAGGKIEVKSQVGEGLLLQSTSSGKKGKMLQTKRWYPSSASQRGIHRQATRPSRPERRIQRGCR